MAHVTVEPRDFAFQNRLQSFSIVNNGYTNLDEFFAAAFEPFKNKIDEIIDDHTIIIMGGCFVAEFVKILIDENDEEHNEKEKLEEISQ